MKWGSSLSTGKSEDMLSTSGGVSENSSGGGLVGAGGGRRSRQNSSRVDYDDAKSMSIVGSALSGSPPPGSMMSRSQRSSDGKLAATGRRRTDELSRNLSHTTISSGSERIDTAEGAEKGPTVILEPGRPTALERRWIDEVCREKEKCVVERFEK